MLLSWAVTDKYHSDLPNYNEKKTLKSFHDILLRTPTAFVKEPCVIREDDDQAILHFPIWNSDKIRFKNEIIKVKQKNNQKNLA